MKIVAAKSILRANDQLAHDNRGSGAAERVFCVNVVGSPGCGKTTLLESLFTLLGSQITPAVIEGDIAGQIDAERMANLGIPVVQINTEGMCHLDANMIAAASQTLEWDAVNTLWIENVGNLVCTAGYDLGEHLRLVVLSTAEGDDKIIKYPAIFAQRCPRHHEAGSAAVCEFPRGTGARRPAPTGSRGPGLRSLGHQGRGHAAAGRVAVREDSRIGCGPVRSGAPPERACDGTA